MESSLSRMMRSKGLGVSLVAAEALATLLHGKVLPMNQQDILGMLHECKRVTR